jgi:hypothetical protein
MLANTRTDKGTRVMADESDDADVPYIVASYIEIAARWRLASPDAARMKAKRRNGRLGHGTTRATLQWSVCPGWHGTQRAYLADPLLFATKP